MRCKRTTDPFIISTAACPHPLVNGHALKLHRLNLLLEKLNFWMDDAVNFRKVGVEPIFVASK